jgi:hypothetical protein
MEWRFFGSLSCPPADEDYLFQEDEWNRKRKAHNPANDWDEDEAVEECFADPLRLVRKSPYIRAGM